MLNKKILVTGAGGFIGSHLVEKLFSSEAHIRALVKYNGRGDLGMLSDIPMEIQKNIEIINGDIRDPFFVKSAVQGCDCVFHLAALIGIPYSYTAPNDYVDVNIKGTLNILQACRDLEIARLVHTSTSETYGTAMYVPIDEKHPLQGQSPYSASKIAADKMVEAFYNSYEMPVVTVRPFNTFGPRQSARAFIPTVISQALTQDVLTLGSLEPVRDFTFVEDTVSGFIKVGFCDDAIGETVNLGVGKGARVGEIVKMIAQQLGKEIMIKTDVNRIRPEKSEVMKLTSDNSKAKRLADWEPEYTLEAGLTKTIAWIKQNLHIFQTDIYAV